MTNEKKGIRKGLLVGILAGAAVGSIVALLYAPKSGKKLCADIKTKSRDLTEEAEKYYSKTKKKASQLIKDIKKKSELLVSDTEEKIDALLDDSEKILSDAKDKIGISNHIDKGKHKKTDE